MKHHVGAISVMSESSTFQNESFPKAIKHPKGNVSHHFNEVFFSWLLREQKSVASVVRFHE